MREYTVFMATGSTTPVRPFVELTKQLKEKINVKVYLLCERTVEYSRIICENDLQCEDIVYVEVGKKKSNGIFEINRSERTIKINIKELSKQTKAYEIWRRVYKTSKLAKLIIDIKDIAKKYRKLKKERDEINKYFIKYHPDMVILYSDIRMECDAFAAYLASRYNIPSMVAPIASFGKADEHVRSGGWCYRKNKKDKFSLLEKYILQKYPKAYVQVGDVIAFRFEPCEILAYALLGILPSNPWVPGTGNSSSIALISQDNLDYAVSEIGEEYKRKAQVTHTIEETDIIMQLKQREELRNQVFRKYKIIDSQIVCFVLTAYANSSLPVDFEMEKDIYTRVASAMVKIFGTVLISLHPRTKREDYLYFHEIPGCIIIEEALYKILPACDVFIGNSVSSTKEMVKNLTIPQIYIPHELYFRGISEEDIKNLQSEAYKIKKMGQYHITYVDDGRKDFFNIIIEELTNNIR